MTDLKTALHNAFNEAAPQAYGGFWQCATDDDTSGDHYDLNGSVNADRLATAIRDNLFDREKVRAALSVALVRSGYMDEPYWSEPLSQRAKDCIDCLIDALAGGPN